MIDLGYLCFKRILSGHSGRKKYSNNLMHTYSLRDIIRLMECLFNKLKSLGRIQIRSSKIIQKLSLGFLICDWFTFIGFIWSMLIEDRWHPLSLVANKQCGGLYAIRSPYQYLNESLNAISSLNEIIMLKVIRKTMGSL